MMAVSLGRSMVARHIEFGFRCQEEQKLYSEIDQIRFLEFSGKCSDIPNTDTNKNMKFNLNILYKHRPILKEAI